MALPPDAFIIRGGPQPNSIRTSHLKSKILDVAQTAVYQVKLTPPPKVQEYLSEATGFVYTSDGEDVELRWSAANLPGMSFMTHDADHDYAGVRERMAYRRMYDEQLNLTFYVDRKYNIVEMIDGWLDYIAGLKGDNTRDHDNPYTGYRMRYPMDYKSDIYVTKFEKDSWPHQGGDNPALEYKFLKAFPLNISSTPVEYGPSDVLRLDVSFSYMRYVRRRITSRGFPEPSPSPLPDRDGIPVVGPGFRGGPVPDGGLGPF